jgi:hypothetical protein
MSVREGPRSDGEERCPQKFFRRPAGAAGVGDGALVRAAGAIRGVSAAVDCRSEILQKCLRCRCFSQRLMMMLRSRHRSRAALSAHAATAANAAEGRLQTLRPVHHFLSRVAVFFVVL